MLTGQCRSFCKRRKTNRLLLPAQRSKRRPRGASEKKKETGNVAAVEVVIQRSKLFQEKDDDDGLADGSLIKKKNKSKDNKPGHQDASASETAPWTTEAKEAGAAAAGVVVKTKSWPSPLQADVKKAPGIMSAAAVGEAISKPLKVYAFNSIQHICKSTVSEGVCVCTFILHQCVCISHTHVVAW
jgi:hypothetical protein